MKIRAEIKSVHNGFSSPLRAVVAVILDECFIIKSVRLVEGESGMYVTMPNRPNHHGGYNDCCHPMTRAFANKIRDAVLTAYHDFMTGLQAGEKDKCNQNQ